MLTTKKKKTTKDIYFGGYLSLIIFEIIVKMSQNDVKKTWFVYIV
jgi:hypothetical protein